MFTFVPSCPCFFSVFRLTYRAYLSGVLYSWVLSEMVFFISFPEDCVNLQTKHGCYCDVSRKLLLLLTPCCCQQNVAVVHRKPECPEHPFLCLLQEGSPDPLGGESQLTGCPLALGVPYFPFSVHSLQSCCPASLKMFKQIFAAVSNFFPLAYSFYFFPDKIWLVTHLASK